MLEIDIADHGDFERSGGQVNNDYAGACAVRAGKSAGAADEANDKFISCCSTARGHLAVDSQNDRLFSFLYLA